MSRKLLILDLALAVAVIYSGARVRDQIRAAKAREAATLGRKVAPLPAPPITPLPPAPPVLPAGYVDIAQKMLFDRSRNSTVVIEVPAAPPPKPMPALPVYHGQMKLPGEAVIVFLSAAAGAAHQGVHPGETIGPFKLMDATSEALTFEWDGQTVRKNLGELTAHEAPVASAAAPARAAVAAPAVRQQLGPGADKGAGSKTCLPNDSSPNGAVVDGYVKVLTAFGPFGSECRWDAVKQ